MGHYTFSDAYFYFISDFKSDSDSRAFSWFQVDDIGNTSMMSRYLAAVYWATTTITTVGYGDITPNTDAERIACIFGMIVGKFFQSKTFHVDRKFYFFSVF